MKKERHIILIDGSNFYFKLKDLKRHNLLSLDLSGLAKFISNNKKIVKNVLCRKGANRWYTKDTRAF